MSRSSLKERAYAIHSMRVISVNQAARYCELTSKQLRAFIKGGAGPHVTRLSNKRIGFTVRDLNKWMLKRYMEENP
jgi:predicted DNA-binding transcriptional regulator AlpA